MEVVVAGDIGGHVVLSGVRERLRGRMMSASGWSRRRVLGLAAGLGWAASNDRLWAADDEAEYSGDWADHHVVLKSPSGAPILRYVTEAVPDGEKLPAVDSACFTHPIRTPSGEIVTDLAPADHPHHRGVFCGWVEVEGEARGDWWGWGAKAPKEDRYILNREARITEHSAERVTLRLINSWRAGEERIVGERITLSASGAEACHVIDYEFKYTVATRKPVLIAQNPFGGFCYRARPRGKQEITGPGGAVALPDSVFDRRDANWPASHWYDLTYRAPGEKVNGVAVMDHPNNPLSTWHVVRGIHMLNPCIVAEEAQEIQFGEPLYLRYRLVAHDGDAASVDLPGLFDAFANQE